MSLTDLPSDFTWDSTVHNALLERVASGALDEADNVPEWPLCRNAIKFKLIENTADFLTNNSVPPPPPAVLVLTQSTASGGLKLAPFPSRHINQLMMNDPPVNYMSEPQALQLKQYIFSQLDQFDGFPFTIQRLCELCVYPKRHYKAVGKYLRAVEKSLLVTSTWDSFPPVTDKVADSVSRGAIMMGTATSSAPATPLFSPIPFLHNDARRSQSRSPPPSPLVLGGSGSSTVEPLEPKAIGLVDELDDPSPGHLSDHPVALSATTTVADPAVGLQDRFVKAEDAMVVDDDKENIE
ncbi:PPP4R2-domain-containing protein [Mycena floridula]|nr:PPP4R2-domain-containing protein [Mycena floridula]